MNRLSTLLENVRQPLTMFQWEASEGGRKCVACHRYRKAFDLIMTGDADCDRYDEMIVCYASQPICWECLSRDFVKVGIGVYTEKGEGER